MVLNLSKQQFLDLLFLIRSARQAIENTEEGELELENPDKSLKIRWDSNTIDITFQ